MLVDDLKITSLEQYQALAFRTWKPLPRQIEESLHCTTGMITEDYEFRNATDATNEVEEMGDFSWFLSQYCRVHNIPVDNTLLSTESRLIPVSLEEALMYVINADKNMLVYNRAYDRDAQVNAVKVLWQHWASNCYLLDTRHFLKADRAPDMMGFMFSIMETNIKKLMKRFPQAYSDDLANNRDLEAERKVLENGNS